MTNRGGTSLRTAFTLFLLFGFISASAWAADLSKYRDFELGTELQAVVKQVGANVSQAKVIYSRPALIQELEWWPQPIGPSSRTEQAKEVVFGFYDGKLYRIAVNYDRYETEGLTTGDFIEAISATYGIAEKLTAPANVMHGQYGDPEEIVARWQDSQYRFDLIRSSYGPVFRLVGVVKRLEGLAQAAIAEAERLDEQEAPQRDAARAADEMKAERAKLERSRLVNKPRFRP